MGLFDFMGTFFFVSLGITFVLILMLVYHFKQRLSESEQKSDKMFEIINTIVKEMGNMKRAIAECSVQEPTCPVNDMPYIRRENEYEDDDDDDEDHNEDEHDAADADVITYDIGQTNYQQRSQENNNGEYDNGEYEKEHNDDEQTDDSEEHDDNINNDELPQVKVVNVDLTYDENDILTDGETSVSEFDLDVENVNNENTDNLIVPELNTTFGEELIHVNKLNDTGDLPSEESESISEEEKMPYNKMSLTQLRAYAVSHGLLSDSSKMKKNDLIKLLESNDEN
jgi:hypothetical protein